jgi:hypothetical protein
MTLLDFFSQWLEQRRMERAVIRGHELTLKSMEQEYDKEVNICQSCEALKLELAKAHDMNSLLIERLTTTPVVQEKQESNEVLKPILPRHQSWKMRQQTLEANDRHNARLIEEKVQEELRIREKDKPSPELVILTEVPITVESIEKELGVTDADESISSTA